MSSRPRQEVWDVSKLLRSSETITGRASCKIRLVEQSCKAEALILVNEDEAAVIVITAPQENAGPCISHVLPIDPGFSLALLQTPPSPSASFFAQSSRPHITLSLRNSSISVNLKLPANETVKTQSFVSELRKRLDIARRRDSTHLSHEWLGAYPRGIPEDLHGDSQSLASPVSPDLASPDLDKSLSNLNIISLDEPLAEDDEYPNPYSPSFSRTSFLRRRIFTRQDEWSTKLPLRIRLATYNVNDRLPPKDTMELASMVGEGDEEILVFGFQEADLRSSAMLVSQGNVRADEWESALLRGLGEKGEEYEKLAMTQYVGVMMLVFVKKDLRQHITQIQTSEKGIGLLGFGGNKAGVAVKLKVHDTTLCFVNCHLAAFTNALDRRRLDYQALMKGLTFPRPGLEPQPAYEEFFTDNLDKLLSVEDAHLLFWLGDLNYRVTMEDDILRAWVKEQRWPAILEKDQLRVDISTGKSFANFNEASIKFPPTYKYIHASTTLDTKRSPAYTDRILWSTPTPPMLRASQPQTASTSNITTAPAQSSAPIRSPSSTSLENATSSPIQKTKSSTPPTISRANSNSLLTSNFYPIKCLSYESHQVLWSDHRPVSASMQTEVRVVDEHKRSECLAAGLREIEKLEEVYRPSLDVETTSIEFGEVLYRRPVINEIRLINNGRVPASYAFRSPSPGKPYCKEFFSVFPRSGTIPPGENWTLRVVVNVETTACCRLSLLEDDLNDVLVLQVEEGKDTFITLRGKFAPTILGLPLSLLPSLPEPIRSMTPPDRKALAPQVIAKSPITGLSSDTDTSGPSTSFTTESGLTETTATPSTSPSTSEISTQEPGSAVSAVSTVETISTIETPTTPPPRMKRQGSKSAKPAKEIWKCLEYLMEHGSSVEDIWIGKVSEEQHVEVIDALDSGVDLPPNSALAVSRVLLYILLHAQEPLLPLSKHADLLAAGDRDTAFAALESVPSVHTNILIGLTSVAKLCMDVAASAFAPGGRDENASQEDKKKYDERYTKQLSALADAIFGTELDAAVNLGLKERRISIVEVLLQG